MIIMAFDFDTLELQELFVSFIAISVAYVFYQPGFNFLTGFRFTPYDFLVMFLITLFTLGTGFFLHEIAHKLMAQKLGARAYYRAWPLGLGFLLIMSVFLRFFFAFTGAVYWSTTRQLTAKQHALISAIGPITNMVLALLFLLAYFLTSWYAPETAIARVPLALIFFHGFSINVFFAWFNLLPLSPLDGAKVFSWNPNSWLSLFLPVTLAYFFMPRPF
ncbi:Uncharacterised protein [Candidatus Gugararchaeum adminiculabundum]|nr:Uncharacterised protein [Candidatus Gugararchaeum adminiculabundum]